MNEHTTSTTEMTDEDWAAYEAQHAQMCECEMDWTCGPCKAAGRFGGYTWIETRYDGMADDEPF